MYGMMDFVKTSGEPLGELVKSTELWAAVYLLNWSEEGFDGRDGVFYHFGRWWDVRGGSDGLLVGLIGGWSQYQII